MLDRLTHSEGIPALERLMQFTAQRHRLILHNIANLSTPGFQPRDVSPEQFQTALGEAIDAGRSGRRSATMALGLEHASPLTGLAPSALAATEPTMIRSGGGSLQNSRQVQVHEDGLTLHPEPMGDNILFHDGNDRSVERIMQGLVENFMTFRASAQLLRSRLNTISMAIRERI